MGGFSSRNVSVQKPMYAESHGWPLELILFSLWGKQDKEASMHAVWPLNGLISFNTDRILAMSSVVLLVKLQALLQ